MPADKTGELQYLYLTTTGRKTGLEREIEIWFVETGGKLVYPRRALSPRAVGAKHNS